MGEPDSDKIDDASATPAPRPIYAIFEGGGAKGVAHVGALHAIAANNLEIVGVAGTSAGALAAVLAAVGLDAADIMDEHDRDANILSRNGLDPIKLLGQQAWDRFCVLHKLFSYLGEEDVPLAFKIYVGLISLPCTLPIGLSLWRRRGHFSNQPIKDFVNKVVRDRLLVIKTEAGLDMEVPDEPTFGDLSDAWPTVVPLKIVVTDVSQGTLEIFDRHMTPRVKVAEAVAASIAIPFIFEPARIPSFRKGIFADGGLVSNLPIWAYVEEKLVRERERDRAAPVPIVGFSLQATPRADARGDKLPEMIAYLGMLIETALAGSQGISRQFMDDLSVIPLSTELDMLDFGALWTSLRDAREAGRSSADRHLRFLLEVKPDRIRSELQGVHNEALEMINARRKTQKQGRVDHLRVNLIRPWGSFSLRVVEGVNMVDDADDRLPLDLRGEGAARAYREKGVRVLRSSAANGHESRRFMTKYERALVRDSVQSIIGVPIFKNGPKDWDRGEPDRDTPDGVLCLDSDDPDMTADFANPSLVNLLIDKSSVLFAAISLEPDSG
jgi:predicted acylesterase/phospholipase RssA